MNDYKIEDYTTKLPRNGHFKSRTTDSITHISVHHSASPMGKFTVYDFARWHIDPNGRMKAPAICYHYSINGDGIIKQVNDLTETAWHTINANAYSIGIELDGNFETEEPTVKQIDALTWLIGYLNVKLNKKLIVLGHKEYKGNATACPGKNMLKNSAKWKI